jgi:NADH-quinone oxidoreductase subunit N
MTLFPEFSNLLTLLPLGLVCLAAMTALLLDAFGDARTRRWSPGVALAGLGLAFVFTVSLSGSEGRATAHILHRVDWVGLVGMGATLLAGAGAVFMTMIHGRDAKMADGEYYCLLLLSVAGGLVVCGANELMTLLVGIELLSLSLYALAGFHFDDRESNEAAFKYFMLGALSSALMVYGIAFIYGATGTTVLTSIHAATAKGVQLNDSWATLGSILLLAGFCFKLSLAPFHMYAPDVYEGAPTPIASLIATGGKIAGFVGLWHVLNAVTGANPRFDGDKVGVKLEMAIAFVALASMAVGNLGAFAQTNLKRLLAYSSVAHAGYAALAYVALANARVGNDAAQFFVAEGALLNYIVAYTAMNLLAFGALCLLGDERQDVDSLKGLFRVRPLPAIALAAALLALTGLPPTVGFFAKWRVFAAAVGAGYAGLALVGIAFSILSAYYYLRPVVLMFFSEEKEKPDRRLPRRRPRPRLARGPRDGGRRGRGGGRSRSARPLPVSESLPDQPTTPTRPFRPNRAATRPCLSSKSG